jgi:hypothetical protein
LAHHNTKPRRDKDGFPLKGQEFPEESIYYPGREEERAARNKGGKILRHTLGLTQLLKAGCASLSRPTTAQGDKLIKHGGFI